MFVTLLQVLVALGSLVCLIMVVVKMIPEEGVLRGILGFICGLYALIWGWQNADRLGIRQLMTIWTALVVIGLILNVVSRTM